MVNDKTSRVKNDSSVSGSGSGEPRGLGRSGTETMKNKSGSSSSLVSVRKSQRLETPKKKDKSVSESPPVRRSERENKFQSKSNAKSPEKDSNSKGGGLKMAKSGGGGGKNSPDKKKGSNSVGGKEEIVEVGCKRKTRLDARFYRSLFKPLKKIKGSGSAEKSLGSDNGRGGNGFENDVKSHGKNSDDEEVKEHINENIDGDEGVSGSDVNIESNKKVSNEVSSDSNVSRCDPKGSPVTESIGIHTGNFVSSASSGCSNLFIDPCDKCLRKKRLDYSSLEEGLCCCLKNSINNMDMSSVVEDRGESGTIVTSQSAEKHGQDVHLCDSSANVNCGTCVLCKRGGKLMHCSGRGCGRSYHPPCLLTPKVDELLPVWYCSWCTKKRLTLGEHSVSEGIELVWGIREVRLSTSEGEEKQKQYFIKYKGLAHIHNHWVPEMLLIHEVPELLANISKRKEGQWKPEWAVPHRLLQKRSVIIDDLPAKDSDENVGIVSNGQCEWLVKWVGLGYDQASWELEESLIHKAPDMQRLIREFETRQDRARMTHLSREVPEKRKGSQVKIGRLSGGGLAGADSCYLNSVNKLREHHYRGHNAVLLDEQDCVLKVTYLISSLVTSVDRPFVIITSSASLSLWEAEFMRLDSSVNVVVYSGSINARKMIRMLEFNEDSGGMMLQVLLSSTEVISEDLEELKGIEWEAVVVDDCQSSCVWAHSISINTLATNWRVLLLHDQLKDDAAEYVNILSFLEAGGNSDKSQESTVNSSGEIDVLKDRLSSFVVCSRFLEYWVPVQISNVQLEQYCSLILSNSAALRSFSKSDPVGSLREILISTRKCCDHPYVVDPLLQSSLGTGYLQEGLVELGIKASGKLHLLDKVLLELKNKKLKVLILFQQSIGGSGRDTTGNILEDYLSFRFGPECYEHVDGGCLSSKKQAALNRFNKESERSFFLLETRACLPSIKLSTIHAAIIFNSDWNPLNDLKALQRIAIDSKLEQIKVFRLYCSCTVEEKVLILAKNDMILDTQLQGNSTSTNHMLLMWGSSYLFSNLDEFHGKDVLDWRENVLPELSIFKEVCEEILSFFQHDKAVDSSNFISAARQNGGSYHKKTALLGEQKIQLEDGVPPHLFWTKLLDGKQPQWKYLSRSSQRNRKRVSYLDDSLISSDQPSDASKKRKKLDGVKPGSCPRQSGEGLEKLNTAEISEKGREQTSPFMANNSPRAPDVTTNEQKELLQLLKPTVLKLCELLLLKDNGKILAEQFLNYIVKNHRVTREPETILQAFQISVCWTVAASLDQKIDHAKSLSIAREKMNFNCREDEADFMYSKLKLLKKMFFIRSDASKVTNAPKSPSSTNGLTKGILANNIESEESLAHIDSFDNQVLTPVPTANNVDDTLRHIKKVKKKCDKMMERLKNKHYEELEGLKKNWEEEKDVLEKKFSVESAVIRSIHSNSSVGVDKLKILDNNYAEKRKQLENQFSNELKKLESKQQVERIEHERKVVVWLEKLKCLVQAEVLDELESENEPTSERNDSCKQLDETACATSKLRQNLDGGTSMAPLVSEAPVNRVNISSESDKLKEIELGNLNVESLPEEPPTTTREMEQTTNQIHVPEVAASTSLETNQVREINTRSTPPASIGLLPLRQELGDESCQRLVDGAEEPVQPIHESVQSNHSFDRSFRTPGADQTRDASNGRLGNEHDDVLIGTQGTSAAANSLPSPALVADHNLGQCQSNLSTREVWAARRGLSNPLQLPAFSVSPLPSFSKDPLENEWERIRKELYEVVNTHEEMKLRLISERDKEIEEVVAQIHQKYDGKIKETDGTFSKRRNELHTIQEKVLMHKFLAEAFRSKCTDTKASSGVQQVSSGSIDQFLQLSGQRPPSVAGSFPGSLHNATCPVRPAQPIPANVTSTTRSPHIPLVSSQVRGHQQSFRPSSLPLSWTSSSMPLVSSNVLTQQPRNNATLSLPALVRPPQLLQRQQNTSPRDHTQDNVRNSESWDNSAFEIAGNVLPPPSLFGTAGNIQPSSSAVGMEGNVQLPPSTSGAVEDVICLSDDE